MLSRTLEDMHGGEQLTAEQNTKRARMQDRSVPITVVQREILFMLSSSNRINNTNGNQAAVISEVAQFMCRRPNMALLVAEEACQVEVVSINFFNYVPPIPSSFFIRMRCSPIAFAEREGGGSITPSEVLTPAKDAFYPIASIAGFYNFPPLKLSILPDLFEFDIMECTTASYFPGTPQLNLEVVICLKVERLGDTP